MRSCTPSHGVVSLTHPSGSDPRKSRDNKLYKKLIIRATDPKTDIWLADDDGNLVQKEVGEMKTSLLKGKYVVHFGLKSKGIEFDLHEDREMIQGQGA